MRILVLDGSGGGGRIALVERLPNCLHCLQQAEAPGRGGAEQLPGLLGKLLDAAGWQKNTLHLIAAVVGPGSFTGLRATLALAQGIALGAALPVHGVAVGEALRRTAGADGTVPLWCVSIARRDRVFLDRGDAGPPRGFMLDRVPVPVRPVMLAGDASTIVAAHIVRRGGVAECSPVERADPRAIAGVALDRLEGRLEPLAALPLYVDPPEARLPAAGLRPPPA